ncbi:hypothetical protein, partial [Streptosporangium sp. NPDC049644]|uniref:hypothetical protein n=1 Tax=Streptosporangium sp. NPDC049644 TaxID=3155507 RepID=UPI00343DB3AC
MTVRYGPQAAPPSAGQAVERLPVLARHGVRVVPLLPGRGAERPSMTARHDLLAAPPEVGRTADRPRASARYGPPVVPAVMGQVTGHPLAPSRYDPQIAPFTTGKAVHAVMSIPPVTDHRSATTGYGPVPGLPAVAGRASVGRRSNFPSGKPVQIAVGDQFWMKDSGG